MSEPSVQDLINEIQRLQEIMLEAYGLTVFLLKDKVRENVITAHVKSIRDPNYSAIIVSKEGLQGLINRLQVVNIISSQYARYDDYVDSLKSNIERLTKRANYQEHQHTYFRRRFDRVKTHLNVFVDLVVEMLLDIEDSKYKLLRRKLKTIRNILIEDDGK